jgi:hypothetical protein
VRRHFVIVSAVVVIIACAQILPAQRARVSPHETHEFDVAGVHVSLTYGRPSKKGRVIWGALVPWDKWWMPGADESTTMVTNKAIVLGGTLEVPAGSHTIYMLPAEKQSTLIISKDNGQYHTIYHPPLDLGRVPLTMRTIDPIVEQMTFEVKPREGGGLLTLTWDAREYSVAFIVK